MAAIPAAAKAKAKKKERTTKKEKAPTNEGTNERREAGCCSLFIS
jgi:ribosomal protein L12E/L44/L45/RPP1/RPP2